MKKTRFTEAVAIKNGHFIAVGSNSEILSLAGATTEIFDLEGKTVLPGLHDSHVHPCRAGKHCDRSRRLWRWCVIR